MQNAWPLTTRQVLTLALIAGTFGISLASASFAVTSIGTDVSSDGSLTVHGNVNFNDATADALLIGQNGGTPDTVTIAGDVSLTDAHWSVSASGAAVFASVAGDGAALTNLNASNTASGTLNDARLSMSM